MAAYALNDRGRTAYGPYRPSYELLLAAVLEGFARLLHNIGRDRPRCVLLLCLARVVFAQPGTQLLPVLHAQLLREGLGLHRTLRGLDCLGLRCLRLCCLFRRGLRLHFLFYCRHVIHLLSTFHTHIIYYLGSTFNLRGAMDTNL